MIVDEATVWAAWNQLDEGCPNPVKTIAAELGLSNDQVAAIVYPSGHGFGEWDDSHEPAIC